MIENKRRRLLAKCVITATFLTGLGRFTDGDAAYVNGPPPATTGGFKEDTCRMCHFDYPLNDKNGSLRLEGLPEKYKPGERHVLTIRLTHPQLERGGFEMTSRFASGERMGQQAGSFEVLDARSEVAAGAEGPIQYVRQTFAGSSPEMKGSILWSVAWRSPRDSAAPVVFHAAANAANYDDSPLGDYPYSLESTIQTAP
jgi:hypothetical protein